MKPLSGLQPWVTRRAAVLRPVPVGAAVERVGQRADLVLVRPCRGRSRWRRSACRRTGTPSRSWTARTPRRGGRSPCRGSGSRSPCSRWRPAPAPAGCRGRSAAVGERSSRRTRGRSRRARRRPGSSPGPCRRRRCCTGPSVGLVPDQPVVRVGLVQVVQHGGPLQPVQILVGWQPVQVVVGRGRFSDIAHPTSRVTQASSTATSCSRRRPAAV